MGFLFWFVTELMYYCSYGMQNDQYESLTVGHSERCSVLYISSALDQEDFKWERVLLPSIGLFPPPLFILTVGMRIRFHPFFPWCIWISSCSPCLSLVLIKSHFALLNIFGKGMYLYFTHTGTPVLLLIHEINSNYCLQPGWREKHLITHKPFNLGPWNGSPTGIQEQETEATVGTGSMKSEKRPGNKVTDLQMKEYRVGSIIYVFKSNTI